MKLLFISCQCLIILRQLALLRGMPFNGRFVYQIVDQFAQRGANTNTLLNTVGHSKEELLNEGIEIDHKRFNKAFELGLKSTKDPLLGIHISQSMNLNAAGLIMQLAQNSRTFKEALQLACDYAMLGCRSLPMRLEETEYTYELIYGFDQQWRMNSEETFQHTLEGSVYFLLKQYQALTNKSLTPIKVTLDYQPRVRFKTLQKWFGTQVFIRDARNSVVFRKQDLDARINTADHTLLNYLLRFAEERKALLEQRNTIVQQVSKVIVNTLPDRARVEDVARELNIGVRTLQRRLKYEDTSFRELLEGHLLEFARDHIKKRKPNLKELAFLLNYSDLSAFSRAYKTYFGVPPTKDLKKAA